jgi:hypothetical protein
VWAIPRRAGQAGADVSSTCLLLDLDLRLREHLLSMHDVALISLERPEIKVVLSLLSMLGMVNPRDFELQKTHSTRLTIPVKANYPTRFVSRPQLASCRLAAPASTEHVPPINFLKLLQTMS